MDKTSFGIRIREARRKAGLSSDKLSELCNCTPVSIRQIESGLRLPSLPKLIDLCNALHVTPNDLLGPEIQFSCDSNLPKNPRLEVLSARIRRLSLSKQELVFSVLEALLDRLEQL